MIVSELIQVGSKIQSNAHCQVGSAWAQTHTVDAFYVLRTLQATSSSHYENPVGFFDRKGCYLCTL